MSDFKHRTVNVNDVRLHFAEAGEGPLVSCGERSAYFGAAGDGSP